MGPTRMNGLCSSAGCEACPGQVVCRCLEVTREEVVTLVETLGLRSVKEVSAHTGAGQGCRCCHGALREILADARMNEVQGQLAAAG